uniref:Uncharacterized protein n=1 Tax=Micrurus paraensis TaxID=1970185 RepID=A0A2D4KMC9_9SAUR
MLSSSTSKTYHSMKCTQMCICLKNAMLREVHSSAGEPFQIPQDHSGLYHNVLYLLQKEAHCREEATFHENCFIAMGIFFFFTKDCFFFKLLWEIRPGAYHATFERDLQVGYKIYIRNCQNKYTVACSEKRNVPSSLFFGFPPFQAISGSPHRSAGSHKVVPWKPRNQETASSS